MPPYSAQQVKHHLEVIDAELAAKRDMLPKFTSSAIDKKLRAEFQRRIVELQQGYAYWNNEYRKLTGKNVDTPRAKTFTQMETEQREKVREIQQRQKKELDYRNGVRDDYLRVKSGLDERRGLLRRLQNYIAQNWHVMFLITLSGGRSWTNLHLIEFTLLKKADQLLKQADQQIRTGRHAAAVPLLESAATYVNAAGVELSAFQDSLDTGTDRIVATIKITSSVMTPGVGTAGAATTVGVATFKAGVEHGTGLAAQAIDPKRVVSQKELKSAAQEVLIEGSAAAAGEFGKRMLAGPIASLLHKGKPTAAQIEAIEGVVAEYYAANSKQLLVAIKDISDGKKPTYSMLGGLIAPFLKSRSGAAATAGEALSEGQVATELESMAKRGG